MSASLTELPPGLAAAVRRARAALPQHRSVGRPEPVITDPDLRAWVKQFSRSGELAAAIREIAANDPDLAT